MKKFGSESSLLCLPAAFVCVNPGLSLQNKEQKLRAFKSRVVTKYFWKFDLREMK
jgi:hypothetical protein